MWLSEEVILLREEMCRVDVYSIWHADWWLQQGERCDKGDLHLTEGLRAYATKQADICHQIRTSFNHMWCYSAELCALGLDAESEVLDLPMAANYVLAGPSEIDKAV